MAAEESKSFLTRNENPDLPETVAVLKYDEPLTVEISERKSFKIMNPGILYLIGAKRYSEESRNDIRKTIRATQPDAVFVELCEERMLSLFIDEQESLSRINELSFRDLLIDNIKHFGFVNAIKFALDKQNVKAINELQSLPGSEFKIALEESKKIEGCEFNFCDRSISITEKRFAGLDSNMVQNFSNFSTSPDMILGRQNDIIIGLPLNAEIPTVEELEGVRRLDLVKKQVMQWAADQPNFYKVYISERDQYMANVLRSGLSKLVSEKIQRQPSAYSESNWRPVVIVGVVGIWHVPGIVSNWKRTVDIHELMQVPLEQPKLDPLVKFGIPIIGACVGIISFAVYRRRFRRF